MDFSSAISICFKKYFDFSGRASRSEFWYFVLFVSLLLFGAGLLLGIFMPNNQSLDGVVHEGLWEKIDSVFKSFGWNVVVIKYGEIQLNAFNEPGGKKLKEWIDNCPNQLYSALIFEGGKAIKERILDDIGDQGNISKLLDSRADDEFLELMANLGGHCIKSLKNAFDQIKDDKPTAFLAYTIKGWGTPLAGHKDNHAGLMTKSQMNDFKYKMKICCIKKLKI